MFLSHRQIYMYAYYTKNINKVWHSRLDVLQDAYTYVLSQLLHITVQQGQPARYFYITFSSKQIMALRD